MPSPCLVSLLPFQLEVAVVSSSSLVTVKVLSASTVKVPCAARAEFAPAYQLKPVDNS